MADPVERGALVFGAVLFPLGLFLYGLAEGWNILALAGLLTWLGTGLLILVLPSLEP